MKKEALRVCLLALAIATVVSGGCKLKITVPDGGRVVSKSGNYECAPGNVCTIDIYDLYFKEEFVAIPQEGYVFAGWLDRKFAFCRNKKSPCVIDSSYCDRHPNLMKILESDQVFYLEPVFYRTDMSGNYSMKPQRESQVICGNEPVIYRLPNPFSISVKHVNEHLLSDFIVGNEVPGADLVHKGVTVSEVDFRNFTQRALFSHPVNGYIDYYLFFDPHPSSKVGFSGSYFAETVERISGRVCSNYSYFFAEKFSDSISNSGLPDTPSVSGSYRLDIEKADIVCTDGSSGVGPSVTAEMEVTQSVNMISFNNPARALAESRTDPGSQSQYPVGGTINRSGDFVANGFARIYYDSNVQEWTTINGSFGIDSINGTIRILHTPGELDGTCTEVHSFAGYRTD
jgi:hypothetical protein